MKKAFVISLLTLLLANTSGYYLLYSLDYIAIKHEVAEMMSELSPREMVTLSFTAQHGRIAAKDVSFTGDDELVYQGHMYDVISKSEINGLIIFKCYSDDRETELSENLSKKIDTDGEQPSQKNKNNSLSKQAVKDFTAYTDEVFCFKAPKLQIIAKRGFAPDLLYSSKAVTHPPPEA